ncbi:hypothetical protein H696_03199 [Fonticula alba]|uniref:RNA helicase n=1 Tax=Fonticula alba TaxID=691883 RepID=A0A058ZBN7_FONAL|nr:hypothetical protein H696_03199 [Fonticula alba]KCV70842.1 hypothetical protein H696_03199 [Fonticula alba]|eukprot:XP_009495358.1 hypothetical protein H696_03199 [Fonticula alba]
MVPIPAKKRAPAGPSAAGKKPTPGGAGKQLAKAKSGAAASKKSAKAAPALSDEDLDGFRLHDVQDDAYDFGDDDEFGLGDGEAEFASEHDDRPSKKAGKKKAGKPADDSDLEEEDDNDADDVDGSLAKEFISAAKRKGKAGSFVSMGISRTTLRAIQRKGFSQPTPIQRKTIPIIMEGSDVVGMARTGSGKTAAFVIPLIERLRSHSAKVGARAIILSPSRELALQTHQVCRDLGRFTDLRTAMFIGGESLDDQFTAMANHPDIIIATPGRLLHVLVEMDLKLLAVEYVVFDEADRLFEMGFAEQINEILSRLPPNRQTLLFSATLPKMLVEFARAGLTDPVLVRLDSETKISDDLKMSFIGTRQEDKFSLVLFTLRHIIPEKQQTIVFVPTRHHCDYLQLMLQLAGIESRSIYGQLDSSARHISLSRFKKKTLRILIVTDVASRGLDIPLLDNVINYNFPARPKLFIHRVGRVARAGRSGNAYSLVSSDELPYMMELQQFLGKPLTVVPTQYKSKAELEDFDQKTRGVSVQYGVVPPNTLDSENEWLSRQLEDNVDLHSMSKVITNAQKMYINTRPQCDNPECHDRAKEVLDAKAGIHPLFINSIQDGEVEQASIMDQIRSFRPQITIFEQGKNARGGQLLMQKTRQLHSSVRFTSELIKEKKQLATTLLSKLPAVAKSASKRDTRFDSDSEGEDGLEQAELNSPEVLSVFSNVVSTGGRSMSGAFRDKANYIAYQQQDTHTERGYSLSESGNFVQQAQGASMDMIGDDSETMRNHKVQMKWDRKKKKFVRSDPLGAMSADGKTKMIRTEAGNLIPANYKAGAYDEWKKRNRALLDRTDTSSGSIEYGRKSDGRWGLKKRTFESSEFQSSFDGEGGDESGGSQPAAKRARTAGGAVQAGKKKGPGGRPIKSEVKSAEQFRKAQITKHRKQEFMESRRRINEKRRAASGKKKK